MEENKYCEICGEPGEKHHIVFRGKCAAMINAKINYKYLCGEHHRTGKEAPHNNRQVDIKYKLELQKKLFQMFSNNYYHKTEIAELLEIKPKEVDQFAKTLMWYSEGYKSLDIVIKCMGGGLYAK
ncbi:hypothetical protein [Clostridium akagii]|uniref:hypothetical protein n=1 Tax=Clostridium akagii TaxID=91623 RepID=UPI000561363B|nr:hypothetical protein [Clostridium akagii]